MIRSNFRHWLFFLRRSCSCPFSFMYSFRNNRMGNECYLWCKYMLTLIVLQIDVILLCLLVFLSFNLHCGKWNGRDVNKNINRKSNIFTYKRKILEIDVFFPCWASAFVRNAIESCTTLCLINLFETISKKKLKWK